MAEEYYTFNETIRQLGISEDELLNLVSGNQLRAFRIDRETKFRCEDVAQLKESGTVTPTAAAESKVIELDELPEDVVMLEDESEAPVMLEDESPALMEEEPLEVLEEVPLVEEEEAAIEPISEDELVAEEEPVFDIFGEESAEAPALVAEDEAEPIFDAPLEEVPSDDLDVMEEDASSFDVIDDSAAEESNPEFEETIVTDSSSLQNTEELAFEDEDTFSTQEITIQEDAISEDEISGGETLTEETMPVDEAVEEVEHSHQRTSASRAHGFAGAPSSRARRPLNFEKASNTNVGNLVWTGILGLLVIVLLYPASLLGTLLFYGFTTGRETIAPGQQTFDGKISNISPVFIPSWFQWIRDMNFEETMGYPTQNNNGQSRYLTFDEREKKGMLKIKEIPAEPEKPAEEAPKPAEEEKPAEPEAK